MNLSKTVEPGSGASVPRDWIGPEDAAWNPTLSLMLGSVLGMAIFGGGLIAGTISPWLATPALAVCIYVIFTPLHESMHGVAHRNRRLNAAIGRLAGIPLMLPLPLFRAAHLAHHSHTNDPERDPDIMVAHEPGWLAPVWFMWTPIHYRVVVYGQGLLRDRRAKLEAIVTDAGIVGVIVLAIALGHGVLLAWLWLLPAVLAILWLALAFDYVPHYPHATRERYYDTRVYPGRLLELLLLGQNYHLVHHLWTTIPWYRYSDAYEDVEQDLRARAAPIGWARLAERAS